MTENIPTKSTQFQKGVSGNPNGKPKGSKNKTTLIKQAIEHGLIEQLQADIPEVYQKGIQMALDGNETMIKFFLDRIMPKANLDLSSISKGNGQIIINVGGTAAPDATENPPKDITGEVTHVTSDSD